ncbi:MAG: hypothetical protein EZS28_035075 [Streblomastix strix]|uniref:Uncharacterized protein n=1 Tax=Streblomastix strix TaxID=222440 RepID=A0A5J4UFH4_9EUKA|nr:MAG: hypothetical protein EZS28_035075 [Streblomastix strix]
MDYVKFDQSNINGLFVRAPKQQNINDCGIYALMNIGIVMDEVVQSRIVKDLIKMVINDIELNYDQSLMHIDSIEQSLTQQNQVNCSLNNMHRIAIANLPRLWTNIFEDIRRGLLPSQLQFQNGQPLDNDSYDMLVDFIRTSAKRQYHNETVDDCLVNDEDEPYDDSEEQFRLSEPSIRQTLPFDNVTCGNIIDRTGQIFNALHPKKKKQESSTSELKNSSTDLVCTSHFTLSSSNPISLQQFDLRRVLLFRHDLEDFIVQYARISAVRGNWEISAIILGMTDNGIGIGFDYPNDSEECRG